MNKRITVTISILWGAVVGAAAVWYAAHPVWKEGPMVEGRVVIAWSEVIQVLGGRRGEHCVELAGHLDDCEFRR